MNQESMSLLEFQERFCDERACLDHLFLIRWPKGFVCPRCGRRRYSFVSSRRLYQCSDCRYQASVTAGTVFHKTRTTVRKWFWMIFMMTRQKSGVSILRMQKLLNIGSYRTAWLMGHKIREAMVDRDPNYRLAGLIEMSKAGIGRQKAGGRARAAKDKVRIVIGIERSGAGTGLRLLGHSDQMDSDSVVEHTGGELQPGHRRCAKGWGVGEDCGKNGVDLDGSVPGETRQGLGYSRRVNALIANISGNIRGIHHGVSIKHLQRYLSEYCYRFNLRRWESQLFDRGLAHCLLTSALTWAELTI